MAVLIRPMRWGRQKPPPGTPLLPSALLQRCTGLWTLDDIAAAAPRNLITGVSFAGAFGFASAGVGVTHRGAGLVTTAAAGSNVAALSLVADSSTILPTSECTVVLGYRKKDTTARTTSAFGVNTGTTGPRCAIHLPYSDGTVYWDFGGTSGTTRLSVGGLSFGDDLWVFSTGPSGMQIWQNGALRASNASNATRTADTNALYLGRAASFGADAAEWWLAGVWQRQLSTAEVQTITDAPWDALFIPPGVRRYFVSEPAAPPAGTTPRLTLLGVG